MLSHIKAPFYMTVQEFSHAIASLRGFLTDSDTDGGNDSGKPPRQKVIGMIGGEPLLHPQFATLAQIMLELIPNRQQRGLWTALDWRKTKHADIIRDTFGYINENRHDTPCKHSPVLVSISDVVAEKAERDRLIDNCWLQRVWSGAVTPRGFFFCEVAGAMDTVFGGPGGKPVDEHCWQRPLSDFQDQIDMWCSRCGIPLNLQGRIDAEEVDDVSASNLEALKSIGSPRINGGKYVPFDRDGPLVTTDCPWRYKQ